MPTTDEQVEITCVGMRLTAVGKLAQGWLIGDDSDLRLWTKKLVATASPGAIYDATISREGEQISVYTGGEKSPTFARRLTPEDDPRVIAWEAEDKTAQSEHAQRSYEKRINEKDYLREYLLPLRIVMAQVPRHMSRYALSNALLAELQRPLTQAERKDAGL